MIPLSDHHLSEISAFPKLLEFVTEKGCATSWNTAEFAALCAHNGCVSAFTYILTHTRYATGALGFLGRINAWSMVEKMGVSSFPSDQWATAAHYAGQFGHEQFIEKILTHRPELEHLSLTQAALTGACMKDQSALVKRWAPTLHCPEALNHLGTIAAQHGAANCVRFLLGHLSPSGWLGALSACVDLKNNQPFVADLLMEHIPCNISVSPQWCVKTVRRLGLSSSNDNTAVWRFVLRHLSPSEVFALLPKQPAEKTQKIINAHQHVLLTTEIAQAADQLSSLKRKM